MGSCTHIVDDRKILNQYEYDAWGNVVSQKETIKNRFKFNGQQLDPITQQYYLRARFYNPIIGRFTQEDTYRGDGLNLYSYCTNNPVYYVDPSGNAAKAICPRTARLYRRLKKAGTITEEQLASLKRYERSKKNLNYKLEVRTGKTSRQIYNENKFKVGSYESIKGITGLDAHHIGQKALMAKLVKNYDLNKAPTINLPKVGHTIMGPRGIISRNTSNITNARQLLARDLFELKRVYPDVPKKAIKDLIAMNLRMYREMRK